MKTWIYKVVSFTPEQVVDAIYLETKLNDKGGDGWELVTAIEAQDISKRYILVYKQEAA